MNKSKINFIDLHTQQKLIEKELQTAIHQVLEDGQYIMGPQVKSLEKKLQEFTGAKHALTCANGTDALQIVLMAWEIGPGDVVFMPSFTYIATAETVAILGAMPYFVDVCEHTFNIDPASLKNAIYESKKNGMKPKCIIPVDLYGHPCDIDAINQLAKENNLKILIDAAQSFGGENNSQRVGSMGDATTTSFFPSKPLGCYGDGGAIFINNTQEAELINSIRQHGRGDHKYIHTSLGVNSRLDTLQAAILIEKLKIFDKELSLRDKVAKRYQKALCKYYRVPRVSEGYRSAWAQFTILCDKRDALRAFLEERGIPSMIYYPIPLSEQPAYKKFPKVSTGTKVSSMLSKKALSIPMSPYIKPQNQEKIIKTLQEFL